MNILNWKKVIEDIARKTHKGELKKGKLSENTIETIYNAINPEEKNKRKEEGFKRHVSTLKENWKGYLRNKEMYPSLKYHAVCQEHNALNGVVAELDACFWDKYYPPNSIECKCYVSQTNEPPSISIPKVSLDDKWAINIGKEIS